MGSQNRITDRWVAFAVLLLLALSLGFWAVLLAPQYAAVSPTAPRTDSSLPDGRLKKPENDHGNDPAADFPKDLQAAALAATVRVVNPTTGANGSGVVVAQRDSFAYILTAGHVVEGAERLELSTFAPTSFPEPTHTYRSATVLAKAPAADLAILRLATTDPLPGVARLCPPAEVPDGAFPVLAVGCDGGGAPSCFQDKVLRKGLVHKPGETEAALYWEVERKPAAGRSGGPLLDRRGRVIGVASGVGDGKGYYAHAKEIREFLAGNGLTGFYEGDGGK